MYLTSYFYYQYAEPGTPLIVRCIISAHGILGIIIYILAMAVGFTGNHNENNFKFLLAAYSLPAASIILSFILFRGNKKIHLLQIINVIAFLASIFIGGMSVTGRWL
ncbi:hypothetical protein D3C78_1582470 [compost metagenome]